MNVDPPFPGAFGVASPAPPSLPDRPAVRILKHAKDIEDGNRRLEEAKKLALEASKTETAARNYINAAQAEFDKAVADLKAEAPTGSNWSSRGRGVPVEECEE